MEPMMDGSGETNSYIDSSVGALVWVRRRNGSWWPGRILAPEELPGSHLLSPRTGTPVKLLGREDGSVDWYNIEKSRRVKAFRCGEFDECIEKARNLASLQTKKREKYARREDAILHALELERKHAEQRNLAGTFSAQDSFKGNTDFDDDMGLDDDFGSDFIDPDSSTDIAPASLDGLFSPQQNKKLMDCEWEDDTAEALPRMRGLQDFGLKIAPSKEKKTSWSSACEGYPNIPFSEDQKIANCISRTVSGLTAPNNKGSCATLKRKRSQAGPNSDESAYKKRDRRRPLNQVLESSTKLEDTGVPDFDVASKVSVPPFVPCSANGQTLSHHNQGKATAFSERVFRGSVNMGSLASGKVLETPQSSHMNFGPSHAMIDFKPSVDKACSSFYNHSKTNCCNERQLLYAAPPMELASLTGSAYVDSLLRGAPAVSCPYLPGPLHMGPATSLSDTGFGKPSSMSIAESLTCLSSFQAWPNYGVAPVCDRLGHDYSVAVHTTNKASCVPDYLSPYDNTIQSSVLPFHNAHCKGMEDYNLAAVKGSEDDGILHSRSKISLDASKGSKKTSRPDVSCSLNENRGAVQGEDEADSFQLIPASCLSSPEAGGTSSVDLNQGHSEEHRSPDLGAGSDVQSEDDFPDPCAEREEREGSDDLRKHLLISPGYANVGSERNEGLDETGFNSFAAMNDQPNDADIMATKQTIHKWQCKGRRKTRGHGRSSFKWNLMPFRDTSSAVLLRSEGQENAGLPTDDNKFCNKPPKGLRSSIKVGSHHDSRAGKMFSSVASRSLEKISAGKVKVNFFGGDRFDAGQEGPAGGFDWANIPVKLDEAFEDEHVPLVSLISKLNGKPIVGHPVLVEKLEKRYTSGESSAGKNVLDGPSTSRLPSQPVWRTGRRTAMQRVPRNCGSVLTQDWEDLSEATQKQKGRGSVGFFGHKNKAHNRKKNPSIRCPPLEKRFPKRYSKKVGSYPQKTRMLSSLAGEQIGGSTNTEPAVSKVTEPNVVACIPVSLVFNRIREVLYKQENYTGSDSDAVSLDVCEKKEPE